MSEQVSSTLARSGILMRTLVNLERHCPRGLGTYTFLNVIMCVCLYDHMARKKLVMFFSFLFCFVFFMSWFPFL